MTVPASVTPAVAVDAWGNTIIAGPRLNGAYTIRHWLNSRVVYVCGSPEQHVRAGMWRRDGRMEGNGQGWICSTCHTLESGLYGVFEREERR